ncbi:MAG TPA: DUF4254 domain-containing protein [Pirellulales bacterium]|jgi:hypothetical protein|nr:DUF4254 domain-containing protein [Pirellulales bacterium]
MIDVKEVLELHRLMVGLWHDAPISQPYSDFLGLVCQQHSFNFMLWHEEDIARSPDASDSQIAAVKRAIDGYNQQRNDAIEKLDECLAAQLHTQGVVPVAGARLNTETPGSAIDRLSISALRIYHMEEQAARTSASLGHRAKARSRLEVLFRQQHDLAQSLAELIDDLVAGRKRLEIYRQFKMYNDPTLNPHLYGGKPG